jgi:uncharacterized protein YgiM (DUF1202 family)
MFTRKHLRFTRWIALALTAALLAAFLPAGAVQAQTTLGASVANASYLNIRSGPGAWYSIVGRLTRNQGIVLIGRTADNAWVQVQGYGPQWVNARYLAIQGDINALAVTTEVQPNNPQFNAVIVNAWVINVRSGPGIGFASVGRVTKDQQVTLVGRSSDFAWVQLAADSPQWINSQFAYITNGSLRGLPVSGSQTDPGGQQPGGAHVLTTVANAFVVNVRNGPGANYTSVGRVTQGQQIGLVGRNLDNSWVQLAADSPQWINVQFVAAQSSVPGLPITSNTYNPTPGGQPTTGVRTHVIASGETLYSIAVRYGVNLYTLAAANGIYNVNAIYAGQTLLIP